jgi:hypothetical protein
MVGQVQGAVRRHGLGSSMQSTCIVRSGGLPSDDTQQKPTNGPTILLIPSSRQQQQSGGLFSNIAGTILAGFLAGLGSVAALGLVNRSIKSKFYKSSIEHLSGLRSDFGSHINKIKTALNNFNKDGKLPTIGELKNNPQEALGRAFDSCKESVRWLFEKIGFDTAVLDKESSSLQNNKSSLEKLCFLHDKELTAFKDKTDFIEQLSTQLRDQELAALIRKNGPTAYNSHRELIYMIDSALASNNGAESRDKLALLAQSSWQKVYSTYNLLIQELETNFGREVNEQRAKLDSMYAGSQKTADNSNDEPKIWLFDNEGKGILQPSK